MPINMFICSLQKRAAQVIKWREENKMKEKELQDLPIIQQKMSEHQKVGVIIKDPQRC